MTTVLQIEGPNGAGFQDVAFKLAALTILSVICFGVGVWLFERTQMQ